MGPMTRSYILPITTTTYLRGTNTVDPKVDLGRISKVQHYFATFSFVIPAQTYGSFLFLPFSFPIVSLS